MLSQLLFKMKLEHALRENIETSFVSCLFAGSLLGSLIVNEILQQGKHAYYHLRGIGHKRVGLDEINPETFYDHLSVYVGKD